MDKASAALVNFGDVAQTRHVSQIVFLIVKDCCFGPSLFKQVEVTDLFSSTYLGIFNMLTRDLLEQSHCTQNTYMILKTH